MAKVSVNLISKITNSAGESPVEVWVNHKASRRKKRLFWVDKKLWDKKKSIVLTTHPNHVRMNRMIKMLTKEYQDRIFDFEMSGDPFTAADIIEGKSDEGRDLLPLIQVIIDEKRRIGQKATAETFRYLAEKIEAFHPGTRLEDIDKAFVDQFQAFLFKDPLINAKSTVHRYIRRLKQVLRREFEIGSFTDQQVLNYKISEGRMKKSVLTHEELMAWSTSKIPAGLVKWRDFFMMLYYLRGARVGDGLQMGYHHIQGDRIQYREQKTGQYQNQLIVPQLREILDRYKGQSPYYLIPIMTMPPSDPKINDGYQDHIKSCTAKLNFRYKIIAEIVGIDKRITNHVARHTFASHAKNAGISTGIIQEMLNHSSESTTENYIQSLTVFEELDREAMRVFK